MIDTYEAEKRLYNEITEAVIYGMYSIKFPIENLKGTEDIKNYQQNAIDYYNGKWHWRQVTDAGVWAENLKAAIFNTKVNYTVARIMREVHAVFEAVKESAINEIERCQNRKDGTE